MCRNFGSVFCKKSLNMGPIFMKKFLTVGLIFKIFWGSHLVCLLQNCKKWNGYLFPEKSLNMGTYFWKKKSPEHGYGSWAAGGTSPTDKKLSTPPGRSPLKLTPFYCLTSINRSAYISLPFYCLTSINFYCLTGINFYCLTSINRSPYISLFKGRVTFR